MAIPDSAHGTNPASAAMAGFQVVELASDSQGNVDLEALHDVADDSLAGVMITLPSTLGLFDTNIVEVCRIVHEAGGLVYGDGANMNALLGRVKLGDLGFDVCHLNLHKTFSTPHGGGGPGAGPVCATERLAPYLAARRYLVPTSVRVGPRGRTATACTEPEHSIGKLAGFHGNFGVLVRAYTYIRTLGAAGVLSISGNAVLNANYMMNALRGVYRLPYDRTCMHEAVFAADWQKARGAGGLEIAKRLLDYGFHAPTMYFPLIVPECLMIEPTESETQETIDDFVAALIADQRGDRRGPRPGQERATHHAGGPPRRSSGGPPPQPPLGAGGLEGYYAAPSLGDASDGTVQAGSVAAGSFGAPESGYKLAYGLIVVRAGSMRTSHSGRRNCFP